MTPASDESDDPIEMDEVAILQRLGMAARPQPALFAAACAERLLPLYRAYAEEFGGDPEALAKALDSVWATVLPKYKANRARLSADVRDLCPEDVPFESAGSELAGYAEHAAPAVLHALRVAETGTLQEAARAARQVTEVAAAAAHHQHPELDASGEDDPEARAVLARTPVVREAATAVAMDLAHALTVAHHAEAEQVRALARAGGEELAFLARESRS